MTIFQKRLTTAIATGAVLLQALVPMASAMTITVEGNGSFSQSTASVNQSNTVNVTQDNDADIDNDVDVDANTGGNSTSFNTGGDSVVVTGDANSTVEVMNAANQNHASVNNCCLTGGDITIKDNGSYSENNVDLSSNNSVDVDQDNDADIDNDVDVDAKTGKNDADFNTNGSSSVTTGDANTTVTLQSFANLNSATVGGNGNGAGTLSAVIEGNGAFSENDIALDFSNDVDLDQDNDADIDNDVDVDADTGDNSASFNSGDEVEIVTGNADTTVEIENVANFNAANLDDCGCLMDLEALIKDNGAFSESGIAFDSANDLDVDQDNDADLDNDVDVDGDTGDNDADFNTDGDDPSVTTGDSSAEVTLANTSNLNSYGDEAGHDVEWEFDLGELWSWLLGNL